MKPKPLKNEIYKLSQLREMNQLDGEKELVFVNQLKFAVELLKKELKIDDFHICNILQEGFIHRKIDKAFEDVIK